MERWAVQLVVLPVVYLKMLAQYPFVQSVVNAGKFGKACKGSPSEQDV
ncbi:hypothetical protein OA144_00220 [bacterium]|nr:hypothetical protein [bacterium]